MATFSKPWLLERLWVHLLRIELPREHQVIVHLFHRRGIGALPVHNRQSPRSGRECHQSVRVMTILGRPNRFLQLFVDDIKPQGRAAKASFNRGLVSTAISIRFCSTMMACAESSERHGSVAEC